MPSSSAREVLEFIADRLSLSWSEDFFFLLFLLFAFLFLLGISTLTTHQDFQLDFCTTQPWATANTPTPHLAINFRVAINFTLRVRKSFHLKNNGGNLEMEINRGFFVKRHIFRLLFAMRHSTFGAFYRYWFWLVGHNGHDNSSVCAQNMQMRKIW